jgi:cyclopropane fatty-acyl-phospholipid synthase-like methyltransferase
VELIKKYGSPKNQQILDIGCGNGRFLVKMAGEETVVTGIELNNSRAQFAISKYGIKIKRYPIENEYWERNYKTFLIS